VDSRQVYRGLDRGTAKPSATQRKAVRHHLLDLLDPRERCSVGRYLQLFGNALSDLRARGVPGLAVGGAGLYVDAILGRFHRLPPADEGLRRRLSRVEEEEGAGALHRRLGELDPETASRLAPRDLQRIIRALEIVETTGRPLAATFAEPAEALCPPSTPLFYLTRDRRPLYARIEARCLAMMNEGLPEEVRELLDSGVPRTAPGFKTLGYSEWIEWALGRRDPEEAFALFVRNSRRYAKRQETWFRNRHPDRLEIVIPEAEEPRETAARVLSALAESWSRRDESPGRGELDTAER
jgi:tRNA dimethylallyltransferase